MSRSGTCIVVTDHISIICPNFSEIYHLATIFVWIIHFGEQRSLEFDLKASQYFFHSADCNFGLEKVGSIEAIQTICPKNSLLSHYNFIILNIIEIKLKITFHFFYLVDCLINLLELTPMYLLMEIIVEILYLFISALFNMFFQLFYKQWFSFLLFTK